MFSLHEPTTAELELVFQHQAKQKPSYAEVGGTRDVGVSLNGYHRHRVHGVLGSGLDTFQAAAKAMNQWKHLGIAGIKLFPAIPSLAEGTNLIVSANHGLVWSINACRIIYLIDERAQSHARFGYAYGTLPEHSERGEELFVITWDHETDGVEYEVMAFSRSNHVLVSAFWPVAVFIQDAFRVESLKAMRRSVQDSKQAD